ncbi:MAG: V-type ATPase 116kDa subunit family protein [bacterium]|nr:V-type ATPase 116kDa subunit family protein [bacterium]
MLSTEAMELVNILVLKEKAEEVVSKLLKKGIFHPVDLRQIETNIETLTPYQVEKEFAEWEALDLSLRDLCRRLELSYDYNPGVNLEEFNQAKVQQIVEKIEAEAYPLAEKRDVLASELKTKETMLSQVKDFLPFPVKRSAGYSFLEVATGKIEEKNISLLAQNLENIPHVIYPFRKDPDGRLLTVIIGLRRDRAVLEKVLKEFYWQKVEYTEDEPQIPKEVEKKIREEIVAYKTKLAESKIQIKALGEHFRGDLEKIKYFIALKKSLLKAKRFSYTTEKTAVLSGWVPAEMKEETVREIRKLAGQAYVEEKRAEDTGMAMEDIPVKLKHTAMVKPFGLLLEAYGLPRYGTIDPTIFVAFSFLLMFGAMFGDIGHGLILVLASLFFFKSANEKVKQAGALILYCGASSTIFGWLYGSVFGYEFASVWPHPINNIMQMFKVSVIFGVTIISTGILINVANSIRDKNYQKALFDKTGLIAGAVYWLVLAIVTKVFIQKTPISPIYMTLMIIGVAALFLKPFVSYFLSREKENFFLFVVENLIDMVEFFMGYLANTVSFIRVAAFALAHAGLFLAIFELSSITRGIGGGTVSWLIIILGNIFVILLEGLVVSIQSVRLNYYEFFSKFFVTGKKEYKPLTL